MVTVVEPVLVVSCADVAVIVAIPAPEGENTPPAVIVPPVAVQFTAVLYVPEPDTIATHVEVCAIRIVSGVQLTATEVMVDDAMVDAALIVTVVDPDFVASCIDVAVTVATPAPDGVNTPAAEIVPPVADHVTAEL